MNHARNIIDFLWVAVPKVIGGIALTALNVVLIAWLPRDAFGAYSLWIAVYALLSEGFFCAAVDMTVLKLAPSRLESEPDHEIGLERAGLHLKLVAVVLVSIPLGLFAPDVAYYLFQRSDYAHLIWLVTGASLATLMFSSALLHLQIRRRFALYGLSDWLQVVLKYTGIGIVLWQMHDHRENLSPRQIVEWFVIAPLVTLAVLILLVRSRGWRPTDTAWLYMRELFQHGKWLFLTLFVSSFISRMDLFFVTGLATIDEVGLYSSGQVLASIPLLIGGYLAIVLNPQVMPACEQGRILPMMREVQYPLMALSLLAYVVIFVLQANGADRLLPVRFRDSLQIFLILLPSTLAGMTSYPLVVSFLMYVRPRFLIGLEAIMLPLAAVGYFWAITRYGAVGAAWVTMSFGLTKTFVAQWAAFHAARKTGGEGAALRP